MLNLHYKIKTTQTNRKQPKNNYLIGGTKMLHSICKYIQENDRNSDIMQAWEEFLDNAMDRNDLVTICQMVLEGWKEDLNITGMTNREKGFYEYLGI
jgi:hypothetical protein